MSSCQAIQTAVGGSRAGPRGRGVALAACMALTVGTRRDYSANNKIVGEVDLIRESLRALFLSSDAVGSLNRP